MYFRSMEISVRPAHSGDVPAMHQLIAELALYEKAPQEFVISEATLHEDGFGHHPIYTAFVAEQGKEIVGMALLYTKYSTWKGKCIFLEDIVVRETHRRQGIGSKLFEACIHYAANQNAGRLEWQVLDWNTPAIDFYKTYGAQLDPTWINGKLTREQLQEWILKA